MLQTQCVTLLTFGEVANQTEVSQNTTGEAFFPVRVTLVAIGEVSQTAEPTRWATVEV